MGFSAGQRRDRAGTTAGTAARGAAATARGRATARHGIWVHSPTPGEITRTASDAPHVSLSRLSFFLQSIRAHTAYARTSWGFVWTLLGNFTDFLFHIIGFFRSIAVHSLTHGISNETYRISSLAQAIPMTLKHKKLLSLVDSIQVQIAILLLFHLDATFLC